MLVLKIATFQCPIRNNQSPFLDTSQSSLIFLPSSIKACLCSGSIFPFMDLAAGWWAGGPCQCSLVQLQLLVGDEKHENRGKTAEDQEPPRTCPPVLKLHHFCLEPSTIHRAPQTWHVRSFSSPAAWLPVESRGHMGHGSPEPTVPPKRNRFLGRSCSFKLIKRWLRHRSRPMIYSFNPNHPPRSSNIKQFWAMMRWRKRKKKRRPMTARAFIVLGK